MTYQEYRALGRHPVPYSYELHYGGRLLYYFGSGHFYTKANEQQVQTLENYWQKFMDNTSGERQVLTEGQSAPANDKLNSKEQAIANYGETGLIAYLAKESGIPLDTTDTPADILEDELKKTFDDHYVQYYLAIRYLSEQHKRETNIADIEQRLRKKHHFDQLVKTHDELFGGEFNINDKQFFDAIRRPGWNTTLINRIAQKAGYIRDRGVVERITKELQNDRHVFIVFGVSHAVMQEPDLRQKLNP